MLVSWQPICVILIPRQFCGNHDVCLKLRPLCISNKEAEKGRLWFSTTQKEEKEDLPPGKHFVSHQMAVISKRLIPPNISSWAMSCFQEWKSARNRKSTEEDKRQCPEDLLENPNINELNYWIPRLVVKVWNKKGEPYPPRTIHQILAGLQRYMLAKNPSAPTFFDKGETYFSEICGKSIGISAQKK